MVMDADALSNVLLNIHNKVTPQFNKTPTEFEIIPPSLSHQSFSHLSLQFAYRVEVDFSQDSNLFSRLDFISNRNNL